LGEEELRVKYGPEKKWPQFDDLLKQV